MKPNIDLVIYKVIINNLNNFLLYKKKVISKNLIHIKNNFLQYKKKVISKNLIHMTIKNVKSIKYL